MPALINGDQMVLSETELFDLEMNIHEEARMSFLPLYRELMEKVLVLVGMQKGNRDQENYEDEIGNLVIELENEEDRRRAAEEEVEDMHQECMKMGEKLSYAEGVIHERTASLDAALAELRMIKEG